MAQGRFKVDSPSACTRAKIKNYPVPTTIAELASIFHLPHFLGAMSDVLLLRDEISGTRHSEFICVRPKTETQLRDKMQLSKGRLYLFDMRHWQDVTQGQFVRNPSTCNRSRSQNIPTLDCPGIGITSDPSSLVHSGRRRGPLNILVALCPKTKTQLSCTQDTIER